MIKEIRRSRHWLKSSFRMDNTIGDRPNSDEITKKKTVLRERKPSPTPKFQPKAIQDSNPNCRITPDPDACRISPKMLWIHYLVGISHFAKFRENRPVTV